MEGKRRKRVGQVEKLSCTAVTWNISAHRMGRSEARVTLQACSLLEARGLAQQSVAEAGLSTERL